MERKIFKTLNDRQLGFGYKNYKKPVRFLNVDGTVNIKRTGLRGWKNIDPYHWLITAPRLHFVSVIFFGFIFLNLIFAWIYYKIGAENFGGINTSSEMQKFISLFFFSAQTLTTVGYGHMHPIGNTASTAAAVESMMGLLSFALATGVLFGRFSRPKADIL